MADHSLFTDKYTDPRPPFAHDGSPAPGPLADVPLATPVGARAHQAPENPVPVTAEFPLPPHRTGPPARDQAIGAAATAPSLPESVDATANTGKNPPEDAPVQYPNRASLESVAQRLDTLWRDTQGPQVNGRFSISGECWGTPVLEAVHADAPDAELKEALDGERERLAWATRDPESKDTAAGLLELSYLPVHLQQALGGLADDVTQLERLVATASDGSPVVSDDLLMEIIADHQDFQIDRQIQFDRMVAGDYRQGFVAAVQAAASGPDAWLPKQALDNMTARVDRFRLLRDDGFDSILRGLGGRAYKMASPDSERYLGVLAPDYITNRHVAYHEIFHALAQGEEPHNITSLTRAFGQPAHSALALSLEEAVVDYAARSLEAGSAPAIDQVDAASLADYSTDTRLLQMLATRGTQPIPIQSFLAAVCENPPATGQMGPAAAHLRAALSAAFPDRDVVADLGNIQAPADLTSDKRQAVIHGALDTYLSELEKVYPKR